MHRPHSLTDTLLILHQALLWEASAPYFMSICPQNQDNHERPLEFNEYEKILGRIDHCLAVSS